MSARGRFCCRSRRWKWRGDFLDYATCYYSYDDKLLAEAPSASAISWYRMPLWLTRAAAAVAATVPAAPVPAAPVGAARGERRAVCCRWPDARGRSPARREERRQPVREPRRPYRPNSVRDRLGFGGRLHDNK